jgi:hypothetical protein
VLLVEKHTGLSIFPKATGIRGRTMEILRSWDLEDQVRGADLALPLTMAIAEHSPGRRRRSRSACRPSVSVTQ